MVNPRHLSKSFQSGLQVVFQGKDLKNCKKNLSKCATNGKEILIRYKYGIGLHGQ